MNDSGVHLNGDGWPEEPPTDEELAAIAPRCTDSGNVDAFVLRHGEDFRFILDWDRWIAWNGHVWDQLGAAQALSERVVRVAREEYAECRGKTSLLEEDLRQLRLRGPEKKDDIEVLEAKIKWQKRLLEWHEQSQNGSRVNSCIGLLRGPCKVTLAELDADPWLFNIRNGTVDLRTGELGPHDRAHYITQQSDVEWRASAAAPQWRRFLEMVTGGDKHLELYLQRLIGYALTGLIHEHALAFHYGHGNNGKSTFLGIVQQLFGDYGCAAPRNLLFGADSDKHPTEFARLYGKRFAVCNEVPNGKVFDEAKTKDLTGGDVISCRRMNEDFWDLTPTHKLHLAGNYKPIVLGDDDGIWRRMRLIPWLVTIPADQIDRTLPAKLRTELPGILRWAVDGCLEWQRVGLAEPDSVQGATAEYRVESDVLGEWITLACTFEPGARVTKAALRQSYEAWCKELGHQPVGARTLARRLGDAGVRRVPIRDGSRVREGWAGVRLKSEVEGWAELPS
jgi:putative DNA primase/helicase